MYLKNLTLQKDFLILTKNLSIEFDSGLNLLVGDQGTGKSSLLSLIKAPDKEKIAYELSETGSGLETSFFDFEKDNPRTLSYFRDAIGFQLHSKFSSHGEANMAILNALDGVEGQLLLMDEPEMALSPKNQYGLAQRLHTLAECNQVIVATHCIPVIESCDHVLHMGGEPKGKKTKSETFLKNQRLC